jgi:DNA-binding beta-propeller fold protein YncE
MFASSWFRPHNKAKRSATRLAVEQLEDRDCPSGSYLFVSSYKTDNVLRYDATTGAFVDEFIPHRDGRLNQPWGIVIGPRDHDVYVSTGHFQGLGQIKAVLRYDGDTGSFLDEFVHSGEVPQPTGIIFGPDGNLYVGDQVGPRNGRITRFDGATGAYLDDFVPGGSGLGHPLALTFGPSERGPDHLDLYVAEEKFGRILRYDGATGAFLGAFVSGASVGLGTPAGLTFGPDGTLYVADGGFFGSTPAVLRFQGPAGPTPGAFIDAFVPAGSGGLLQPFGVLFGPDHNGDGQQDLYVTSAEVNDASFSNSKPHTSSVKVYDGVTGAYLSDFVAIDSGGLNTPTLMTFTETDPVTLAYTDDHLLAASTPPAPVTQKLAAGQVQPLFAEALARWQAVGADTSGLGNIQIQIGNLGGHTLGMASGHTIWLDDNAVGWGWFIDPTPWDDSEFTTPGDQGEQNRMDLLTALEHEVGHLLGREHEDTGVMIDTLTAGTRRTPSGGLNLFDPGIDWWSAFAALESSASPKRA